MAKKRFVSGNCLLGSENTFTHLTIHIYMYSFYFSDIENRTGQDSGSDGDRETGSGLSNGERGNEHISPPTLRTDFKDVIAAVNKLGDYFRAAGQTYVLYDSFHTYFYLSTLHILFSLYLIFSYSTLLPISSPEPVPSASKKKADSSCLHCSIFPDVFPSDLHNDTNGHQSDR